MPVDVFLFPCKIEEDKTITDEDIRKGRLLCIRLGHIFVKSF